MARKHDVRIDRLSQVTLFRACSPAELRELAGITTELDVAAGDVLCTEGQVGRDCFVVVDGEATVTIGGDELDTVGPGGFFGEMALLDGGPRVATVIARTDMKLLVLSRGELGQLLNDVPSVARKMLEAVGGRRRAAHAQRIGV